MNADDFEQPARPTFGNPGHESLSRRGRKGGFTAHANRTPAERTELAKKAAAARWEKENKRRAELGLAATKRTDPILSADELEPWLDEVDRQFPSQRWENKEQRRRQALLLARKAAADAVDGFLKKPGRDV